MTDLTALIERVGKLTGPDREVDAELAAHFRIGDRRQLPDWAARWTGEWRPTIQGWVVLMHDDGEPGPNFRSPGYTSSLDAAVALVERKLPGWAHGYVLKNPAKRVFEGYIASPYFWSGEGPEVDVFASAQSPALAVLSALLRALEQEGR